MGPKPSSRGRWTRISIRSRLFLSSYSALFLILAVRFDITALRYVCASLFVIGFADTWLITHKASRRLQGYPVTVDRVEDLGSEVGGYLASYLLPFVTIPEPTMRELVGYLIFILVAGLIYVKSDLARVNPTLYIFGFQAVKIGFGRDGKGFLLTRNPPRVGDTIVISDIGGILLETE